MLREKREDRRVQIDRIADVFGDPLDLASYYVEPDCQQFNPADYANEDAYHVVREPIFDRLAQFLSGSPDRQGRHLFVLSDAGTGKTSLLVMLKLSHLTATWSKPYECELLKLGPNSLEMIEAIPRKASTVLLLDGLDEDPEAWNNQDKRIQQILAATSRFFRTVITCRTQFLEVNQDPFLRRGRIELHGHLCPVIYTSLFSDRQVLKYLQRRFADRLSRADWERRAYDIVQKMGMLSMRPMLLAHIDDLVESEQDEWTLFGIYEALVQAWLLREQRKIYATQALSVPVENLLKGCRHAAFVMQSQGRSWITRHELENHAKLYSGIAGISLMQLGVRSLLAKDSERNFRFSHYSILEFLIVDSIARDFPTPLRAGVRPTDLMRAFFASWLRSHPNERETIARLSPIGLQGTDLKNANLASIHLTRVDCRGADFANSDLSDSSFERVTLEHASFTNAQLERADFRACALSGATFTNTAAHEVKFKDCDLQGGAFQDADLRDAQFLAVRLDDTAFVASDLSGALILKGRATRTRFEESSLREARLVDLYLEDCSFSRADIRGAKMDASLASTAAMFSSALQDEGTTFPSVRREEFDG